MRLDVDFVSVTVHCLQRFSELEQICFLDEVIMYFSLLKESKNCFLRCCFGISQMFGFVFVKLDFFIYTCDCRSSDFKKCYYHGDTGLIHCLQGKGLTITAANKTTASTYTGCGIDYVSQEFFFT